MVFFYLTVIANFFCILKSEAILLNVTQSKLFYKSIHSSSHKIATPQLQAGSQWQITTTTYSQLPYSSSHPTTSVGWPSQNTGGLFWQAFFCILFWATAKKDDAVGRWFSTKQDSNLLCKSNEGFLFWWQTKQTRIYQSIALSQCANRKTKINAYNTAR